MEYICSDRVLGMPGNKSSRLDEKGDSRFVSYLLLLSLVFFGIDNFDVEFEENSLYFCEYHKLNRVTWTSSCGSEK